MKHFGIIGKPLAQSFSANHFNRKFADEHIDAEYSLYPLESIEEFPALIASLRAKGMAPTGFNVTIPTPPFLKEAGNLFDPKRSPAKRSASRGFYIQISAAAS